MQMKYEILQRQFSAPAYLKIIQRLRLLAMNNTSNFMSIKPWINPRLHVRNFIFQK